MKVSRVHLTQQGYLLNLTRAAKRQYLPGQGQQSLTISSPQGQNTPTVFYIGSIHHQTHFSTVPMAKQMRKHRTTTSLGNYLLVF
jgi:hypothetical protein